MDDLIIFSLDVITGTFVFYFFERKNDHKDQRDVIIISLDVILGTFSLLVL